METVENKYIAVNYRLYALEEGEDQELVEETKDGQPFVFISGLGTTLEAFEDQIVPLEKGDEFEFTIPARDGYGEYDNDHVLELPKNIFEIDGKFDSERVEEGSVVPLMTSDGQRVNGTVLHIESETVRVDLNHPLAGADLIFEGVVVESRPATNEEIQEMVKIMSGEGCGCGCEDQECGDNCGCEGHC